MAALPAGGAAGSCRYVVDEEAVYCYTGAAWVALVGGGGGGDASEITYTPAVGADWGTDPDDAAEALDQLALRLTDEEAKADDDTPEADEFGALALTDDVTSSGLATTIASNAVALGADTTGNYAAGDAEAGAALTGDSATAFFSTGTIEAARLPAVTALASACTDAQVLGGTAAGTGVECQADATGTDDQVASEVPFTPAGTVAATDVQAAIEEVASEAGGAVGGADTQVLFNDGGVEAGDAGMVFNKTTDALTLGAAAYLKPGAFVDQTFFAPSGLEIRNAANTAAIDVSVRDLMLGAPASNGTAPHAMWRASQDDLWTAADFVLYWSSVADAASSRDTSSYRYAAGLVGFGDGASPPNPSGVATARFIAVPQAVECTDSGDGSPGALTLTPTSSRVHVTNSDSNGCTVTMGETGMTSGFTVEVIVVSNAGGTVDFADSAGVLETPAAGYALAIYDTATFGYVSDRFVAIGSVDN